MKFWVKCWPHFCTCGHMLDHSRGLECNPTISVDLAPTQPAVLPKRDALPSLRRSSCRCNRKTRSWCSLWRPFPGQHAGADIKSQTNLDCNAHAHNAQIYISWGLWTWHIAFFCQIRKGRPQYSKIKLRTQEEEKLHAQMLKCISLYKYISIARVSFEKVIDFWVGGKFPLGTERATLLRLLSVTALLSDNQRGEKMTGTLSQRPQNTQSCFFYNPEWFFGFRPYLRSLYIRKSQRKVQK